MFGLPIAWLVAACVACVALFFGAVEINHRAKLAAAHSTGVAAGKAGAAITAVAEAKNAGDDWRKAEQETPADADRLYFQKLCAQHASCAARAKYRAIHGGTK